MSIFEGLGIAMPTPFGRESLRATEELIEYYGQNADAIIALGTTGEASTMTEAEKTDFIKLVRRRTKLPLIVGAGSNSTSAACDNVKRYSDLGVDGALVVTPYYNKCTQEGLVRHYAKVCEEGLPVIAYNVPARTGVNILPNTAARLAEIKNLVGLKEASGDFGQMMEALRLTKGRLDLYSGDDDLTVPAILMGYKGVISVTGNVAPVLVKTAVREAMNGNATLAANFRHMLAPLTSALFSEVNPIPVKAAMNMLGISVGEPRLPLTQMTDKNMEILRARLEELGLL